MEPWILEQYHTARLESGARPRCVRCGEGIATEQYLDLEAFGLQGAGCQRCVEANLVWTEQAVFRGRQR